MEANQYCIVLIGNDSFSEDESTNSAQCVVISPAELNRALRTVTVAPLGPDTGNYPTRVKIKAGTKPARIILDQITTIENKRILKITGELAVADVKKVKLVLKEIFID